MVYNPTVAILAQESPRMGGLQDLTGKMGPIQFVVLYGGLYSTCPLAQLCRCANSSIKKRFIPLLKNCNDNGVDINPALIIASKNGREAVVSSLLAAGADKNAATPDGVTALGGH